MNEHKIFSAPTTSRQFSLGYGSLLTFLVAVALLPIAVHFSYWPFTFWIVGAGVCLINKRWIAALSTIALLVFLFLVMNS